MEIGIAQLATLLTAAGVTVYVLGSVGLAFSINLTHAKNLTTAWHAVSLMPRTVVAVQGMRIWRRGLIRIVVFLLAPFIMFYVAPAIGIIATVLIVVTLLVFSFGIWMWVFHRMPTLTVVSNGGQYRTLRRTTAVLLGAIGILMTIADGYLASKELRLTSDDPANWDIITGALLIFLAGTFVVAIPAADRVRNPLPRVMLIGADASGEPTSNTVGWLVTHSDGYWHLFDSRHVLLSVPDKRVTEARVDDPEMSEQHEANSKVTEQLPQAPPQKSRNEHRDADRGED